MDTKQTSLIVKIFLIIGVIFCAISLILPWMGYNQTVSSFGFSFSTGIDLYPWGAHYYSTSSAASALTPNADEWMFFYMGDSTFFSSAVQNFQTIILIFAVITFVLAIVALLLGIKGIISIGKKKCGAPIAGGIIAIIAPIIFVVGINFAFAQLGGQFGAIMDTIGYSWGFYLMILAGIMYIIGFVISKAVNPSPIYSQQQYQQTYYQQQPAETPPTPQQQVQTPPMQPQTTPNPPPPQQQPPQPVPQQPQPIPTQTPPFCPKCGVQTLPGTKFCSKCGHKF